ncbi:MAG: hypothetical protein ACR2IF_05080 [Terriglobales bacterium]
MKARQLFCVVVLCTSLARAQAPKLEPSNPDHTVPVVTFEFSFPGSDPGHFSIAVEPDGKAAFRADEIQAGSTPADPYLLKFVVSDPARTRIFQLARALNFFQGDFQYRGGERIANMGAKTLRYDENDKHYSTAYNYSTNPAIQELTRIFQNMAATLQFGYRLTYLHRFDKLGLDGELKLVEDWAKDNRLGELQVLEAPLRDIFNDYSVLNISRRRAERLLLIIKANASAHAAAPE